MQIDSKDKQILSFLHREDGADLQQLCSLLDVTRNAVRQRIARMEGCGYLTTSQQAQTRGRPRNVFRITDDGLRALGEDYRELAVALWETICSVESPEIRQQLISSVRDRLASRFLQNVSAGSSASERLGRLVHEMKASGFNVEADDSLDLPILRETNCPFPRLADVDETICQVEREVLEQVLGTSVEFRNRCRDGHHCCEFEVNTSAGSDPS